MPAFICNGKPESEPTCETRLPRGPGLACGAAGPCKHSQCLTLCLMPSLLCKALMNLPCGIDISMERQSLNPPVRPVCPEAPVWPVEPLAPASSHNASHCVTCLPFSVQSSDDLPCNCIINGKPDSEPTCETRLPGSPGLACGAAGPCKQSQCGRIVSHPFSFSVQSSEALPCLHRHLNESQSL